MISDRFLLESTGSWQESTGKNPKNFQPEYCFYVPAISGVFLQDPVTGIFVLGSWRFYHSRFGFLDLQNPKIRIFLLENTSEKIRSDTAQSGS
jgi:hypothetical protein